MSSVSRGTPSYRFPAAEDSSIMPSLRAEPSAQVYVSRETYAPGTRRRRWLALPVLMLGTTLLVAACGAPPGPQGWAAPQPIKINNQQVILVPHKAHLYALPDGSSTELWEFPPKDKNSYPASGETRGQLAAAVSGAGIDAAARTQIEQKIGDLKVSGPTANDLKAAITNSGASDVAKKQIKDEIDVAISFEKKSLDGLKALYGDIGVSSDGKTAYVPTFKGVIFALDTATGEVRWVRDAAGEKDLGAGMVGGIAVDGNAIYFGTKSKRIRALDAKTAQQLWSFEANGEIWATPTVDGDTVYATSLDGSVYALDKSSGKQRWHFTGAGSGIASRPVVAGDAVYVGSFDNKLYSIKTTDGTMNWSLSAGNWFWATPVVQDNVVYAASLDGKVYAVDATTGVAKWPKPFDAGSAIRSGPVIAAGGLVVAARDGNVYKLDLNDGHKSAGSPVLAGTSVLANLTVSGDTMVLISPTSATLYVLNASGDIGAPASFPLPQ